MPRSSRPIVIRSSNGDFQVNRQTGEVISREGPDKPAHKIARFDLAEYFRWEHKNLHLSRHCPDEADIIHVSFWKRDGTYVTSHPNDRRRTLGMVGKHTRNAVMEK